jgi:pimeloyl-ACP methyl ester carboxylesterase
MQVNAWCRGLLLMWLLVASGCSYYRNLTDPQRLETGYTLVLPGIDGPSFVNSNMAQGLQEAGLSTAIEVHDWTTGHFLMFPVHLRHSKRNRLQAQKLASKITNYQDQYPGRPVHLVGHSGGGAMIIWALEALPEGRSVTSATLLAPAISPKYNLSTALARTSQGIWNYHSPLDAAFLVAGTTLAGTVDGRHMPSAGAYGFNSPPGLTPQENALYTRGLHQIPYDWNMLAHGNLGGHLGPTWVSFMREVVAPVLLDLE